ncbi:MAG TPA: glycosyltransferase [Gaiellaceae bacterium]|jgi:glycosyltransferase involved in cell wall biosynthesis
MSDRPLVGIVTPVYNGADYLAECIESVLAQSYEHWEYVVCDNASTDGSADIAEEYARRDPRVRVERHTEHVPFLRSWNRSVRALPEGSAYCKVICADDMLMPTCLEQMVGLAEATPSVGVVGAYRLSGTKLTLDGLGLDETVIGGRELCRRLFLGRLRYIFGSPTSTLLRADLVRKRGALYDESYFHADTVACFDLLQESDFGFVHEVLTYTRIHPEALTSMTRGIGSYRPEHLRMLIQFGPGCLTPEQFERRLAALSAVYARTLAKRTLRLKEPEYRRFHARQLGLIRNEMTIDQLGRGVVTSLRRRALTAAGEH